MSKLLFVFGVHPANAVQVLVGVGEIYWGRGAGQQDQPKNGQGPHSSNIAWI